MEILKNNSLDCWFAALPVFVVDTKIIYGYNFVAPFENLLRDEHVQNPVRDS